MLASGVKAIAAGEDAPEDLRRVASLLAKRYLYPVDIQVIDGAGELLSQGEANDMKLSYWDLLQEALK